MKAKEYYEEKLKQANPNDTIKSLETDFIELLDKKEYTEQEELVNDMMMLIASFSGRYTH